MAEKTGLRRVSGSLFWKSVGLFLTVVCVALLSNGFFEIIFSYCEHTDALVRIQREQAEGAAEKIGQFINEIENQMGWTTQVAWSAAEIKQRKFDAKRLLRPITQEGKMQVDLQKAFMPIGMVGEQPIAVAVNKEVPARNVAELIGIINKTPGGMQFAATNRGG
jgi:hypothetical protein